MFSVSFAEVTVTSVILSLSSVTLTVMSPFLPAAVPSKVPETPDVVPLLHAVSMSDAAMNNVSIFFIFFSLNLFAELIQ